MKTQTKPWTAHLDRKVAASIDGARTILGISRGAFLAEMWERHGPDVVSAVMKRKQEQVREMKQ